MLIVCSCCKLQSYLLNSDIYPYLQIISFHNTKDTHHRRSCDSRQLEVMPGQKLALHNCYLAVKYYGLAAEYQLIISDVKLLS